MNKVRKIHKWMTDRAIVKLNDGRNGKIIRIDTEFPRGITAITVLLVNGELVKTTPEKVVGKAQ